MPTPSRGMMAAVSDPFERFAAECELSVSVEAISVAPRDVVASPADADEYFLVTLTGPRAKSGSIHLLIVIPPTDKRAAPTARDALWWLAADAWAIERQLRQTATLRALLCGNQYQQLLELYEGEVSASGESHRGA